MKRLVKLMLAGAAILVAGLILNLTIVAYSVPTNDAYADEGRPSPRTSGRGRYDSEEFVLGESSDTPTAEQVVEDVFATEPSFGEGDGFQPVPKRRRGLDVEIMGASPESEQPLSVRIEIAKLQRQADALTKAGFKQVADQLREQAKVLAQLSSDLRNRGWDRTEPEPIEIDQEVRELQEKARMLEREAAELEEHGEHEAAEHHRRQARQLMMQLDRPRHEPRWPQEAVATELSGLEAQIHEERELSGSRFKNIGKKIQHLNQAAENLTQAGMEQEAERVRHQAEALLDQYRQHQKRRNEFLRRWREEHTKAELERNRRDHEPRQHPHEFGELLHDLRNEIRELRAEVREMRQLIEKNLKHEVVEEVEEEAGWSEKNDVPEVEEAEEAREEPVDEFEGFDEPQVPQVEEEAAAFDLDSFGVPQEPKRQEEAPAEFGFELPAEAIDEVPVEEPSADNSVFDSN